MHACNLSTTELLVATLHPPLCLKHVHFCQLLQNAAFTMHCLGHFALLQYLPLLHSQLQLKCSFSDQSDTCAGRSDGL